MTGTKANKKFLAVNRLKTYILWCSIRGFLLSLPILRLEIYMLYDVYIAQF